MAQHRSLDEFLGGGEPTEDEEPSVSELDGLTRTYEWCAEPRTCTGCGEERQQFWRVDDRLVCPGCKKW